MNPEEKDPARFYCNFKVQKQNEHGNIPPVKTIISGSGSITENISIYLDHHIKHIATEHQTYLQDTPHFLRIVNKLNQGPKLAPNAMLVTSDITSAYHNIPQDDESTCLLEALEERESKLIPSLFLVKLMDLIQKYNNYGSN